MRWTETTAFVIYVETRAGATDRGNAPQTRISAHHLESGRSVTRRGADPQAVFEWIRKALERPAVERPAPRPGRRRPARDR